MHRLNLHICQLLIFLVFQSIAIKAQTTKFKRFSEEDGFPPSTVLEIYQDKIGFLWIGTTDGLYKYDGNTFKEYRYIRGDKNSLSNNYIRDIAEDQKGRIWMATKRGLSCYLPEEDRFTQYFRKDEEGFIDEENNIHSVVEDHRGYIWYSTYHGVFRLDVETDSSIQFLPNIENSNSIAHELVWSIYEDQKQRLWFATQFGLSVYENKDDQFQFQNFTPDQDIPNALHGDRVWEFAEQKDGTLWVGSDDGLYQIVENNGFSFKHYKSEKLNPNSLSGNFVNCLYAGKDDRIWVGTWQNGLNEVKVQGDSLQFLWHQNDQEDKFSISGKRVHSVLEDHSGNIWVGTSAGLDQIAPKAQKFTNIYPNTTGLPSGIISAVHRDSKGNLWVGTLEGLAFLSAKKYSEKNFQFQVLQSDTKSDGLRNNHIRDIYEDDKGILWITNNAGLHYTDLDKLPEAIKDINLGFLGFKDGLPHRIIYHIQQKSNNEYWVATYGQLSKMYFDIADPKSTNFTNYDMDNERDDALTNALTYVVEKDQNNQLWIGTFNGLSQLVSDDDVGYFRNFKLNDSIPNSISNNSIADILNAQDGSFWIGTRGGLNKVIQKDRDIFFETFGIEEGLPNDVIQSIEEDQSGNLWLGTNRGLIHFNPEIARKGNGVLNTYTILDGLTGTFMVSRASHKDQDGTLFFGSAEGLNIFNADQIVKNEIAPSVVITELKINNKTIHPTDTSNTILDKSILLTENIKLAYHQNKIDLSFAALDFTQARNNQYWYKLEGFDEDWIDNKNLNYARYSNVPPGKYTFWVKGSNNDLVWSETPAKLEIQILPPPWKTWWAYSLYALGFIGIVYRVYQVRVSKKIGAFKEKARIEKARFEEREQLRKQNAADFHDELGHRLTKISLFLELAERSLGDQETAQKHLQKIKQNAGGLSSGIRDLIWTLNPEQDSLFQTLIRIQEFGDQLFDETAIEFQTTGIDASFESIFLDPNLRKHLLLIFKEAMNNALKHAEANSVLFCVKQEENQFEFELTDDGKGMNIENVKRGNGLQNMKNRAEKMNASIEMISLEKGTQIRLFLKIPHMG